jgi:hypothetical protein
VGWTTDAMEKRDDARLSLWLHDAATRGCDVNRQDPHTSEEYRMLPESWRELDDAVLEYLALGEATPAEIGKRLGMSERSAVSIIAMLANEGRVRICRVGLNPA